MQSQAKNVDDYFNELPDDRKACMLQLRHTILTHLPKGFEEQMSYGMVGYVVPHTLYPKGYHCDTKLPLPFLSFASQKNNIALYHMGIYANKQLLDWFVQEYPKHSKTKLDMGKSCIRFKKPEHIPFALIGELVSKLNPQQWIDIYEAQFLHKK
jgi:hypothetical protein